MSTYNEHFDYKSAHLSWIKTHPNFISKAYSTLPVVRFHDLVLEKPDYYSTMVEWYSTAGSNKIAYLNYRDDIKWLDEQKQINLSMTSKDFATNVAFITVGFNHQEFTIKKAMQFLSALLSNSIILDGSFGVMETHRENGIHPHVHFKIFYSGKTYKSVLIQTIMRTKHAKKLILQKNFIDIKEFDPVIHEPYLNGDKQDKKMPYVEKDIEWRTKNQIPEKVFKDTKHIYV